MKRTTRIGVGVLVAASFAACARADVVRLKAGSEIRGQVLDDPGQPDKVLVQTGSLARPIVLDRSQVVEIVDEVDIFDEYAARKAALPETAQAQYDFGRWCESNRLTGLAEIHYRKAIEIDKEYAPAHKKLGHVQHNGEWMTYDAMRAAQGLVQYKGRWTSPEVRDRLASRSARATKVAGWVRTLQRLRGEMQSGSAEQQASADAEFDAIRDPDAVPALLQVFGDGDDVLRFRLARALGEIPGPEARDALVRAWLAEESPNVRTAFLAEVQQQGDDHLGDQLLGWLRNTDTQAVGRVARGLADLNITAAVPPLIKALVQVEEKSVVVPVTTPVEPSAVFGVAQPVPILTGPVVGPGVVAYGATSVPLINGANLNGGWNRTTPSIRYVTVVHRNDEVLSALIRLTGQDFGFDSDAWHHWTTQAALAAEREEPARRVRQP